MIGAAVISCNYMASPTGQPVPSPSYVALLKKRWDATFGEGGKTAVKAGKSEHTYGRIFNRRKPSLKAVLAFARALTREGVSMPPPVVAVVDDEDYEWIKIGRHLRAAAPGRYREVLGLLRDAGGRDAQETRDAEAEMEAMVSGVTDKRSIGGSIDPGDGETEQ
jgi:hypothetical protein